MLFTFMDSVKDCNEYGDNFFIEADEQSLKDSFDKIKKLTAWIKIYSLQIKLIKTPYKSKNWKGYGQ